MRNPKTSRAVNPYIALWTTCKESGVIPPQPDSSCAITENSTILDILSQMAALAEEAAAAKTIDLKSISSLKARRFWVIVGDETPACVKGEEDDEIRHMAAIKFTIGVSQI